MIAQLTLVKMSSTPLVIDTRVNVFIIKEDGEKKRKKKKKRKERNTVCISMKEQSLSWTIIPSFSAFLFFSLKSIVASSIPIERLQDTSGKIHIHKYKRLRNKFIDSRCVVKKITGLITIRFEVLPKKFPKKSKVFFLGYLFQFFSFIIIIINNRILSHGKGLNVNSIVRTNF